MLVLFSLRGFNHEGDINVYQFDSIRRKHPLPDGKTINRYSTHREKEREYMLSDRGYCFKGLS